MSYYLSGIDWVINTLDYLGRKKSGVGNISQVVLELNGRLREDLLRERINHTFKLIPFLSGYPSRALNLCPYWQIDSNKPLPRIDIFRLEEGINYQEITALFGSRLNAPFQNKREHLIFNLAHSATKSYLGMVFDHRLLDARGAEVFLGMIGSGNPNSALFSSIFQPAHLNNWCSKFTAGRKVNRAFLHLTKGRARTLNLLRHNIESRVRVISFDNQESLKIAEDSYDKAGYLMFMPYLLAKSVCLLHGIFEKRNLPRDDYLIPVSIDKRSQDSVIKEPFFNHLSFFLFRIKTREADNFMYVLDEIKKQMYEQVKSGLPEAIQEASYLMRIAPLPLVYLFISLLTKGEIASFSFSFVGESPYPDETFINEKIENIFHLPRVPFPPGIGIFFNQYKGRLNAKLSFVKGLLDEEEIEQLSRGLGSLHENQKNNL